jgi:hypothetical protein
MVSRADVAAVALGCLEGLAPANVTFEIVNDKESPATDMRAVSSKLRPD